MADYCSATELKTRLDISGSGYDTTLATLATAASRWIDQHCRVPTDGFAATAAAHGYYNSDAVDGRTLVLDAPLLSVTTLANGDGSAIAAGSYWLRPRNGAAGWYIELKSSVSGWVFDTDTGDRCVRGVGPGGQHATTGQGSGDCVRWLDVQAVSGGAQ